MRFGYWMGYRASRIAWQFGTWAAQWRRFRAAVGSSYRTAYEFASLPTPEQVVASMDAPKPASVSYVWNGWTWNNPWIS